MSKKKKYLSKKTRTMLEEYYNKNIDVLKEAGYRKDQFMSNIKSLMHNNNVKAKTAVKMFGHKTEFVSKTRISAENIVSGMKNFKYDSGYHESRYSDFRREVVGWNNKLD